MSKEHRFVFWGVLLIVVLLSVSSITFPIFVAQTIKNQNIICIDAGHGGSDPGKVGNPNILEKDINLSISLKLEMGIIIFQIQKEIKKEVILQIENELSLKMILWL